MRLTAMERVALARERWREVFCTCQDDAGRPCLGCRVMGHVLEAHGTAGLLELAERVDAHVRGLRERIAELEARLDLLRAEEFLDT